MLILRCTAQGEAAHAAHAHLGENAIHKAARDIARLAEMRFEPHERLGTAHAQVTQIQAGMARNQVPDRCEFFVDIRTTPNLDHAAVAAAIDAALESEVTIHSQRYEPVATDESEPIVRAALAAAGRSSTVGSATTSDWAFLKGVPAVKVGPGDTRRSHRPNEFLFLHELEAGAAFYSSLVRNYFAHVAKRRSRMPETLWAKDLPLDEQLHAFTVGHDRVSDLELLPFDAEGSAAHARMLGECGLLEEADAKALVAALRDLKAASRRAANCRSQRNRKMVTPRSKRRSRNGLAQPGVASIWRDRGTIRCRRRFAS